MQNGGTATVRSVAAVVVEVLTWVAVGGAGLLMLTQAVGWNGTRLIASLHALTPYVIIALVPIAAAATWLRRDQLAIVASLIGVGGLLLAAPVVLGPQQRAPVDDAVGLRVATINLYFGNPIAEQVGDALLDDSLQVDSIDVLVFNEYTAEHQSVLLGHELADQFPFRVERDGLFAGGVAIWSRYPIVDGERPDTINYSLDSTVVGPDGDVRLVAVHPPTPVFDFGGWLRDLELVGEIGSQTDAPTLMIGDFNASYWHPPFRDLLRRGFVDAHMADGQGFATSWPTDEFFPAFVQLDHALTNRALVSTNVENFDVPGSDHRGFVVTVAPAR